MGRTADYLKKHASQFLGTVLVVLTVAWYALPSQAAISVVSSATFETYTGHAFVRYRAYSAAQGAKWAQNAMQIAALQSGKADKTTTVNGQPLSGNINITMITGNAGTASAFDHIPTGCTGSQYAISQSVTGVFTCGTPAGTGVPYTGATGDVNLGAHTFTAASFIGSFNANDITSGTLAAARGGAGTVSGIMKANGSGTVSAAVNSDLPAMSATVGGAVPTPPNDSTKFLNGQGAFSSIAGAWGSPTFTNSWVAFGGFESPGYMIDSAGIVHLKGLVKSGSIGASAFTLPVGYRPSVTLFIPAASNSAFGELQIGADGTVTPAVGSNTWFSLTGIQFSL